MFVVAIVGPNGVGKTSLLNLLLGLVSPVRAIVCVCVFVVRLSWLLNNVVLLCS